MKCPKCGYLGFETSDRCRNCGYDFSLAVPVESPAELPLHQTQGAGAPLADFTLDASGSARVADPAAHLDLDRLIGVAPPADAPAPGASSTTQGHRAAGQSLAAAPADPGLPLFSAREADDLPLITTPRPVRPPLSVRRATPDVPRVRSRPRAMPRRDAPPLQLEPLAATPEDDHTAAGGSAAITALDPAGGLARVVAAGVDVLLVGGIDGAVLYFTLAIAGLTADQLSVLPPIPLGAFLLLLNGGYLVAFTAAGGQTIGKMLMSLRVMGDDGQRVDLAGAVLRSAGCLLSVLTAGLGYLPAFVTADGRALQDRLAGTRVVRVR